MRSNLQPEKVGLKVRTRGPRPRILVRTFSLFTSTFAIGAVQASTYGHLEVALTCLDLTYVFVHIFLMVPAPFLFLSLGAVLLGSRLLPRVFGYLALALGVAFEVVGFVGLLSAAAVTVGIFLQIGQELWVVAAAFTLVVRAGTNLPVGAVKQ